MMEGIGKIIARAKAKEERPRPIVSAALPDGALVETVFKNDQTSLCVFAHGAARFEPSLQLGSERVLPYSPKNNLLRHEVVLLPSEPEEYGSEDDLLASIRDFLHRYVDLSPRFETLATSYVFLSWLYGRFSELPYLRVRGDPGSGKTRFLQVVGSVCYLPIFASGASTVSPLFRILDAFRGTLVLDESDFRISDEKAEIVKILNNGNARGFPVLRSEPTRHGEYDPRAYAVFGPKLIATRGFFEDRALESRCLTEDLGTSSLRDDIPITLPPTFKDEALHLRNQLLAFRFQNWHGVVPNAERVDPAIEPRLNQVFGPLLAVTKDEEAREAIRALARQMHRDLLADRGMELEARVLEVIRDLWAEAPGIGPAVKDIASLLADRHGEEYEKKITPRWIGWIVRKKLRLATHKSDGVYVIPLSERPKLARLCEKHGLEPQDAEDGRNGGAPEVSTAHRRTSSEGLEGLQGLQLGPTGSRSLGNVEPVDQGLGSSRPLVDTATTSLKPLKSLGGERTGRPKRALSTGGAATGISRVSASITQGIEVTDNDPLTLATATERD